jgi:hypothetical protein
MSVQRLKKKTGASAASADPACSASMYSAGVGVRGSHAIAKNTMIRYLYTPEQLKKMGGDALISVMNSAEYGNVTKRRGERCQRQCHRRKALGCFITVENAMRRP